MQIGQTVSEIWPFYEYSRWRLSDILDMRVWTIHKGYLVVFITLQTSVTIRAVVSIICKFKYFVRHACK